MGSRSLAVVVALSLGAPACGDEPPACYAGEYVACSCADGAPGFAPCAGDGYGACDCTSGVPGLTTVAGSGGAGGSGGAELLSFLSACETNEQCETGLCYDFSAKGPHCSMSCSQAGDCPPPSPGCNMMGICKVP